MDPEEITYFRDLILARRAELLGEGDLEIEPVLKEPSEKVDEDAAPLTEMNQVIASRRNKQRTVELQRIEAALARLNHDPDEFGYCAGCGDDIPRGRLELMPWAMYCVKCEDARSPARGRRRRHIADYIE